MATQAMTQTHKPFVPVLPLRDVVVYPYMVIPLFVGRENSIDALDIAMKDNKQILLVSQKEAEVDEPGFNDLYQVGTLANMQIKGSMAGTSRARLLFTR